MISSRYNFFDYIRVVAIVGIILCHFFCGVIGDVALFGYLASTFNCVFFAISAILFGMQWNKSGRIKYDIIPFLKKRLIRLAAPLYPLLLIVFLGFLMFDIPFSNKDVLLNFTFLSWFAKLWKFGHLWFVTMIVMCYVWYGMVLCRVWKKINIWIIACFLFLCLGLQYYLELKGLPGYLFLILFYCGVLFLYAENFLDYAKHIRLILYIPVFIIFNTIAIYAFYQGIYDHSHVFAYWFGTITGFSWLVLFIRVWKNVSESKVIVFFSSISYEIYLVHHPFCFGLIPVYEMTHSWIITLLFIIGISILLAWLLHWVAQQLLRSIKIL